MAHWWSSVIYPLKNGDVPWIYVKLPRATDWRKKKHYVGGRRFPQEIGDCEDPGTVPGAPGASAGGSTNSEGQLPTIGSNFWFQFLVLPDRLISTPNCLMWFNVDSQVLMFLKMLFFGGWYQPASTHASTVRVPSTRRFSGKYQATLSVFPRIIFCVDESFWFYHSTSQAFAQRLNTNISQALSLTVLSTLLLARFKLISGFISIDKFGRLTRIYSKLRHYMKLQWLWDRKDLGKYAGQKSKTWHRQVSHSMIIKPNVGIVWYRSQ